MAIVLLIGPAIAIPARATLLTQLNNYLAGDNQPEQPQPYGDDRPLTDRQAKILQRGEIAWPQSRAAVISKFGFPNAFDSRADYYLMGDGRQVAIVYSSDGRAIGIE